MRSYDYRIAGEKVTVHRVEHSNDLPEFDAFIRRHKHSLAVDTEATGTAVYASHFRVRLVQFGTPDTAYVLPVETGNDMGKAALSALEIIDNIIFHNAMYDVQVVERCLGLPAEKLWPRVTDTRILAHLVDPRGPDEGGTGQSLEALTAALIDQSVADEVKGLMSRLAREHKTTKSKIYGLIDLAHPEYNLYAGMDVILTARLARLLAPMVPASARGLIPFEHKVAEVCSYYERTGFLLDVGYSESLSAQLSEDEETYCAVAASMGCENVNSSAQVAEALIGRGVTIPDRTPTGAYKVDKHLLDALIADGDQLAYAVKEAKKCRKWRTTWVDGFLDNRDEHDRCHPHINPLRARTARMSITGIPAQTLPASDALIRRCFLSESGHRVASVDYKGQELRVLAALSGDPTMIEVFRKDANLHLMTARAAFGEFVEKDSKYYKWAKTADFQKVYGGGAAGLATQINIDFATAKLIHNSFDKAYPAVGRLTEKLEARARRDGFITTESGRRLPVDRKRAYSALNYAVQSTSRDVTCRGLIRAHEQGFTPFIRLPIHDEAVASFPMATAEPEAEELARAMAEPMGPVFIDTESEVGSRSWGSLYGSDF